MLQGIKTVVTVNDPALVSKFAAEAGASDEVWVDYPDDGPPLRAKHPGDPRAAFTPWLAHQACIHQCFDSHKWYYVLHASLQRLTLI